MGKGMAERGKVGIVGLGNPSQRATPPHARRADAGTTRSAHRFLPPGRQEREPAQSS
jgi:hypothetical protein